VILKVYWAWTTLIKHGDERERPICPELGLHSDRFRAALAPHPAVDQEMYLVLDFAHLGFKVA
jgi:hypothetical protein